MSSTLLRRLAILLAVLLAVWVGIRLVRGSARGGGSALALTKLDKNAVDAILIERPTDTVRLLKQGGAWTVNGWPAAKGGVDDLIFALGDSSAAGELVAENATSHGKLGVDSATGRRITAKRGTDVLASYWIGKRGANYESGYLRRPDQNAVYQVKGRLIEFADRTADDWRDKAIVAIEPDSLTAVEVQRGKQSYRLVRDGKQWTLGGAPADSGEVATLLGQFKRLEATGFATTAEADSARFDQPERQVRLLGPGGRQLALLAFDSTTTGFWVRRDTASVVYRVDQYAANQLTPADSTLRK
jgi:hypothetical protein